MSGNSEIDLLYKQMHGEREAIFGRCQSEFGEVLTFWASAFDFAWKTHSDYFDRGWRKYGTRDELSFLAFNNARCELVSAVDSFLSGYIRGPNLLVKNSLVYISTGFKLLKSHKAFEDFIKKGKPKGNWTEETGTVFPVVSQLHDFLQKTMTHDPFASFAGLYTVPDREIDKYVIPPWADHYLGIRWGTAYSIQSGFLVLLLLSDISMNKGVNLWTGYPDGEPKSDSDFQIHMARFRDLWSKANDYLKETYGDRSRAVSI